MKNNLTLTIAKPCAETWDNFRPIENGGFCSACSKIVVDFTAMSDAQIINFFSRKQSPTCGRFHAHQLKTYSDQAPVKINPGIALLKAGLISLLLVLVSRNAPAQSANAKTNTEFVQQTSFKTGEASMVVKTDQIIKGVVTSEEDHMPLPGVNIYLKGSTVGTTSDAEGKFEFPRKLQEGDVLVFSFIGLETKEYVILKNNNDGIEIQMMLSYVQMLGAVAVDEVYTTSHSGFRTWWQKIKAIF